MARGMGGHSPSMVMHHLKGLKTDMFPIGKKDILQQVQKNGAPKEVMDVLNGLPDKDYNSLPDIMKGIGSAEF